jgi:hypothetical protein
LVATAFVGWLVEELGLLVEVVTFVWAWAAAAATRRASAASHDILIAFVIV